jgi:TolB-like protein
MTAIGKEVMMKAIGAAGKRRRLTLVFLFVVLAVPGQAVAQNTVALLSVNNLAQEPAYDYLSGIIQGILLYDLSQQQDISLVDRRNLERVLEEQELRLSGITERQDDVRIVGEVLGADYLLNAGYVFLGDEVLISVDLIDVVTAESRTFSERGRQENTIHLLSEKLVQSITGRRVSLVVPDQDRSILSLRDETPGSIALHSHLIDAEIFLNGDFVGYTTGNARDPFMIEDLPPGRYTIKTDLGRTFGVVKLPEFEFLRWEAEVVVDPGRRTVVRDESRHFNEIIYFEMQLLRKSEDIPASSRAPFRVTEDVSFVDREGKRIPIDYRLLATPEDDGLTVELVVTYDGEEYRFSERATPNRDFELEENVGKIRVELSAEHSWGDYDLEYEVWRTDIEQGMF